MAALQKTSQQESHELQQLQDLHNSLRTDGSYVDVVLRIVFVGAIRIHGSTRGTEVMSPKKITATTGYFATENC